MQEAGGIGNRAVITRTHVGLGLLALIHCDYRAARETLERSLATARQIGRHNEIAAILNGLGLTALMAGDLKEAAEHYNACLALGEAAGRRELALAQIGLGWVAQMRGSGEQAVQSFTDALRMAQEIDLPPVMLEALLGLAALAAAAGHLQRAAEIFGLILQHPASQAWTRQRARQLWARSYPQQDCALPALVLTPTPEARLAATVNKILAAEPG